MARSMFSQTRGIVKHDKVNVRHVRRFSRDNSVPSAESLKIMSHLIIVHNALLYIDYTGHGCLLDKG
jgi:hypothetical protein